MSKKPSFASLPSFLNLAVATIFMALYSWSCLIWEINDRIGLCHILSEFPSESVGAPKWMVSVHLLICKSASIYNSCCYCLIVIMWPYLIEFEKKNNHLHHLGVENCSAIWNTTGTIIEVEIVKFKSYFTTWRSRLNLHMVTFIKLNSLMIMSWGFPSRLQVKCSIVRSWKLVL